MPVARGGQTEPRSLTHFLASLSYETRVMAKNFGLVQDFH